MHSGATVGRSCRLLDVDYESVLADLIEWGTTEECVRGLVLTGSGGSKTAHRLSDRDVEVYTADVEALLADEAWWSRLGEVLVVERLENADGHPTRLVYYADGKLDFTLIPADQLGSGSYVRPFEVLLDKDGATTGMQRTPLAWPRPSAADVDESVNWAYAAALMCAKALVRDELWAAKFRDVDLKDQLLHMIEWDHRTRYGDDLDTRYLGTRMHHWMDADIRAELRDCWGHFDKNDSAAALRRTVALYARLAERTADALELPSFDHERLARELTTILASGDL